MTYQAQRLIDGKVIERCKHKHRSADAAMCCIKSMCRGIPAGGAKGTGAIVEIETKKAVQRFQSVWKWGRRGGRADIEEMPLDGSLTYAPEDQRSSDSTIIEALLGVPR